MYERKLSRGKKPPIPKRISKDYTDLELGKLLNTCDLMNNCNDTQGGFKFRFSDDKYERIDYLKKNLSSLPYVEEQFIDKLFSNGLTTGDETSDKQILEPFLYHQNIQGITNYEVIQSAVIEAWEYGKSGIRWLSDEDGIIRVPHDRYCSLQVWDANYKGFKKTIAYAIALTEESISIGNEAIDIDKDEYLRTGSLTTRNQDISIVAAEDFINLRRDVSEEDGISIFERDQLRYKLLCLAYERLNYDLKYDGPGRIIFWLKDDIISNSTDMSTSELISQLADSKDKRAERATKELEEVANAIKNSGSDNVILSPSMFEDKIEHLPRVTKATEFFDWIKEEEGIIVAQSFGLSPALLELGEVSGNVSMEKIIDNAMVNNIVPLRERVAVQMSHMLASHLGVEKIYFNKYELKQNIDYSTEIFKLGQTVSQLMNVKDANGVTKPEMEETANYIAELIVKKLGGEVESMANSTITSTRQNELQSDEQFDTKED